MIIRRRHTANFTTIGNALFEDKRLAADEVGVLAWLLSRPHDWEVRRPALMRRWDIGAVSCKRIFNNWLRTGWAQARKTRLSNGTFHIVYEIRDEPGRDLTDEEIREALSLVSSEAVDDESEGEVAADHPHVTERPPPCQPGVDDQGVVTDPRPIETLPNTESLRTESTQAVRVFVDVKAKWPIEHVLSLVACEALHAGLTDTLREAAFQGVELYLDDCRKQNRKVCDLATYYRERRWERFAIKDGTSTLFPVQPNSPQAHRWREYFERTGDPVGRSFEWTMKTGRTFTAKSEWPPPMPKKEVAIDQATGPPES